VSDAERSPTTGASPLAPDRVRLAVGSEDEADIIADLEQGLKRVA
jgi:O-acetylhomoserine/O-acetylserine sulfhydrylase-like pyridoxal-dependent enzyme